MKAAVIVFPGSNCDRDIQVALRQSMGSEPQMVWHKDADFDDVDLICLPGGFSYGDYLRCGAMSAKSPVMKEVVARANKGVPVLGICNGFQILTECGLVPGALMRNSNLKFVCRDLHLKVERNDTVFTKQYQAGQNIRIPVAHHDGNYFVDSEGLKALEDNGQVAFRYSAKDGSVSEASNPNGSLNNIAGVYNTKGNVLGMMPHPERLCEDVLGGTDGRPMFDSLVAALS
ncbi:phosphoribosylformylglycinamidine synthase [Kiloniella spongiae]|uniref:Phosphoribosylformylglycinamidine synthase subunit PurQ n=1 Tax=Kiloniella spongiae TaxID=1489064 RepID=A0A0H2MAR8_9PROT|nr:phosphoribosylformylglycinamidine synthase subunit PurQ [Kiloniella spongiae]KLN59281.1 phosphoribosylformylglycinamidine synthase [Kiloniella spongiae]